MKLDEEEKEIYCVECNGYLWSASIHDDEPELRKCPYQKDPMGHCTGRLPDMGKATGQPEVMANANHT
jgi:hypothetical protein